MLWHSTDQEMALNMSSAMNLSSMTLNVTTIREQVVPLENRLPIMITFISLYGLIFFFGITGNALVVGS
jgi:cellobiose-specific phosphotransferase system component IIC